MFSPSLFTKQQMELLFDHSTKLRNCRKKRRLGRSEGWPGLSAVEDETGSGCGLDQDEIQKDSHLSIFQIELAEKRIAAAERARQEIINETDCRLQDASRALKQAQSRIEAAEDRLTAVEFHAQAAEAEARETKKAPALVEEAIRRRLLCASPEAANILNAVA
jgi:hypothetical protein